MKVGDKVKVNNRTIEYTGKITAIRWRQTTDGAIRHWEKSEALIQCKSCRVRSRIKDLEVL